MCDKKTFVPCQQTMQKRVKFDPGPERLGNSEETEDCVDSGVSYRANSDSDSTVQPNLKHIIRKHSSNSMSELEGELPEMEDGKTSRKPGPCLSRQRRTKSLYGASPSSKFGPKATVMKNQANVLTIQDPATQRLTWYKQPLSVLVIKKIMDVQVLNPFVDLVLWLIKEKQMVVFVESKVFEETALSQHTDFNGVKSKLYSFKDGVDDLTDKVDLIICLGGDGTLLYASSLFQASVPPVMAFHLGSLGFLSPFEFSNHRIEISKVLRGNVPLTLRTRLKAVICKDGSECAKAEASIKHVESKQHRLVLNEVVIDRGRSPYLCNLDLYIEHQYITSVQGDGLIISTPTGSTAYSAAAGASMIHPNTPAILITPICPHSLSFRPIVVPAGVEIKVMISVDARSAAWAAFDGRNRQELQHGDTLRISTSIYPVPSICSDDQISDWFESLAGCLHWNVRKRQRAFNNNDSNLNMSHVSLDSLNISDSDSGTSNGR